MKTEDKRTCSICGSEFSGAIEFCPVCMLRQALSGGVESGESSASEDTIKSLPEHVTQRFEHYELVTGEDGKPVELGRGAMGVTYKAFDVDLHCPVTLKVISERYLGDESARARFLREARASASVRHPNVASVFHLGRTGQNYFYAMEFVEGETLENLIKRSSRLDVKLALEIATQVAAGLAAVHKQNLVHRDIKPSNIMVNVEEGSTITVKIIDLGLAKSVIEPSSQTAISMAGGFAGTPEFASPEQFGGVGVDIRSDLYALGVTLWQMVTSHPVFRGSPLEVMYQHQHTPLPIERLEGLPQPLVVLLEMLLEKDPARRFQDPAEVLNALPAITNAIERRRKVGRRSLRKSGSLDLRTRTRKWPGNIGPDKISIARLPITGSEVFGREEDIAFLDNAWAKKDVKLVTIVAWAGVGKSTLVNHWLRRMAAKHYRSADLVFGWSFYRQGTSGDASSADEFLDFALSWFGDPDPRIGTAWEKGERLAKLVAHRRTLLVLDGLEPLQSPPGPQEGRLREPALQALLRDLATFNTGLCLVTTRMSVADIAEHERGAALRLDLEQLSSDAGARLLRAFGVKGDEEQLRTASDEFSGHCLALTLLASYLTDAYNGDIRCREEVSARLAHDVRQGAHARKVMESYKTWFGEGPEVSVLRMLGLFDRPADEKALRTLLNPPVIFGLTESLAHVSPAEWRTILGRLRRARLLSGEDPQNPGQLDSHPLVREYFGEQLRSQRIEAWQESNRRLYAFYQALAPPLPNSFIDMEPLFLAVICGCNAGLFREVLHEVYIPRIQRGNAFFAADVLGARGALLAILVHFFEDGRWGSSLKVGTEEQNLATDDELFILMQAGLYLTATRGLQSPEARICYYQAEPLCHSLNRPLLLYSALTNKWRYSLMTDKLKATMQIARELYSLGEEHNDSALMLGAHRALAATLYYLGDFESALKYATGAVEIWRSGRARSSVEEVMSPTVVSLCMKALSEWHIQGFASCQATIAEAMSLADSLTDLQALAIAQFFAAFLAHFEGNAAEVERLTSALIELATRQNFAFWLPGGKVFRGWARSACGNASEGLSWIEEGIEDWRATGATRLTPYYLAMKAEALHLAERDAEALEAIKQAGLLSEKFEERWWCAELHRLRAVFLKAIGAEANQIEVSFCEAIRIARDQKSSSLATRAEATYAEYHGQKREP
jgi:serine/threonine protein kinase/tetratricopeptide (TPR) repeat protein